MLSISAQQMGQLEADARQRFTRSMVRHLRSKFTQRATSLSDERLHSLVEEGVRQARGHGVVYKDDVRRYLEYMVIYGAPLDQLTQMPWIGRILNRSSLSGSEKLRLIGEHELAMMRGQA